MYLRIMSLTHSNILIVRIILSNGGTIIYEINDAFFTEHVKFTDREGIDHDIYTIYKYDSSEINEVQKIDGEFIFKVRESLNIDLTNYNEEAFLKSYEPFELNGCQGLKLIRKISERTDTIIGIYYIQVRELSEILEGKNVKPLLPIFKENYVTASMDSTNLCINKLVHPIDVVIDKKEAFSTTVQQLISNIEPKE